MELWYIIRYVKPLSRKLRYIHHYFKYGFSPHECWNLDCTIAQFVLPRLKHFRRHIVSIPNELSLDEWKEILDKMIYAMEYSGGHYKIKNIATFYEYDQKCQEGFELFGKYFTALWN